MSLEKNNNVQVKEGYYKRRGYNTLERFISYFYQIDSITNLKDVSSILEIGPGNKLVSKELMDIGFSVTTCDFDEKVFPDVVADVRSLPFQKESFDCVMACQILEHIPFADFEKVVSDIANITKKYAVISLPERHVGFNLVLKFPFIQTLFKRKFFDISIKLPIKFKGFKESDQHYFEIDYFTTSKRKIVEVFERHFHIEKVFNPPLNKYHRFYILKKK